VVMLLNTQINRISTLKTRRPALRFRTLTSLNSYFLLCFELPRLRPARFRNTSCERDRVRSRRSEKKTSALGRAALERSVKEFKI